MPQVHKNALVPYSAQDMYALVADIGTYPEFVPWVSAVEILSRDEQEVRATIELTKGPVSKTFTTMNTLYPGTGMRLSLLKGPFSHLDGEWGFHALSDAGSKITLDMDFEFSSRLLAMTVGPIFNSMVNRLVDAFVARAGEVYDRK